MRNMGNKSGLTVIEMMIVLSLLTIVGIKIFMVVQTAGKAQAEGTTSIVLDDQARRVLDRIAYAIMGSTRETLFPDPESPVFSASLEYEVSLGLDASGEVVWGDPEKIELSEPQTQVIWRENPDEAEERRVVWCNTVSPFLEGETPGNGLDDNGNGLIDEEGLCFSLDGDRVTIRLTLQKTNKDGTRVTHTVETVATCRN